MIDDLVTDTAVYLRYFNRIPYDYNYGMESGDTPGFNYDLVMAITFLISQELTRMICVYI